MAQKRKPSGKTTYDDPYVSADDLEFAADVALGIVADRFTDVPEHERKDWLRRMRNRSVGAQLTARQILSDRRKRKFVQALAHTGSITRAATAAGWCTDTARKLRKTDPLFAQCWDNALEFAADSLEEEARRRAVDGVLTPVFQQGALVGYVRNYSDNLLIQLLKANNPNKFRDNHKVDVEARGSVLVVWPRPRNEEESAALEKEIEAQQAVHRGNIGEVDPLS